MVSQGQRELRSKVITKRKRYSGGALVKEEEAVKEIQGNLRGNNLNGEGQAHPSGLQVLEC